jgi:hypothetical protein
MSALELHGRPYVVFDPNDKQHRRFYSEFVRTASWGACPVRFLVPEDHGDLVTMIQRSLVKHYVEREFPDVVKKQRLRAKKRPAKQ